MKRITKIRAIGADGIPLKKSEMGALRVSYRNFHYLTGSGALVVVPKIRLDLNIATWASAMGYQRITAKRRREFETVKKVATQSAQDWLESRFEHSFKDFDDEANAILNSRYTSVQQR
jgi:hypothetical protein|tara:strand:- start:890 stop:1243 length:354 start_codon:yes stop_codon:yes gene_type:complete